MKNRLFITTTLFFALGLILPSIFLTETKAQGYGDRHKGGDGSYRIQGKVFLPDGSLGKNVIVKMSGADFTNSSTETDRDGKFLFDSIPAGNYTVLATGSDSSVVGSEFITIDRDTPTGQTFNIILNLSPKIAKAVNPLFANVPKAALEKYKNALETVEKSQYKPALILLAEAIKLYPDFAAAYNEAGQILLKQNELEKALPVFSKAIELYPNYFEAKLNYGFTLLSMKDFVDSEKVLKDVLRQHNDVPKVHLYLGMALIGLKKFDEAEVALKKTISLKGGENLPLAHRSLGGVYIQQKKNAEAIAELDKFLQLSPNAPDAEKIKGTIEELKKQK